MQVIEAQKERKEREEIELVRKFSWVVEYSGAQGRLYKVKGQVLKPHSGT